MTAAGIVSLLIFFRYEIENGFSVVIGDRYDQVIELAILEHWRNALLGLAPWSQVGYFFPVRHSLGFNDAYFLFGLIYALFRGLGADPYLSGDLLNIALRGIGFAAFYIAARRIFRLRPAWSCLGAVLFTLSNNLFVQAGHGQLFGVGLAPVMAVLLDGFVTALLQRRRNGTLVWGVAAAAFYAGWLMTSFYMAWFFLYFTIFLLAAWLALGRGPAIARLAGAVRAQLIPLGGVAVALMLFLLPFLSIYLPNARNTGMHQFSEAKAYTLSPLDVVNVGYNNVLYHGLVHLMNNTPRPGYPAWTEETTGLPLLLLVLLACGMLWLWQARRGPKREQTALLAACAVATIITWALTLQVARTAPWWLVYHLVPGAKAVRVVARYQIFLVMPVVGLAMAFLQHYAPRMSRPVIVLLVTLLIVEQFNTTQSLGLDRKREMARLAAIPAAPSNCRAFFVTHARPGVLYPEVDHIYSHNVDAMIIAETKHLPTLNGFATFVPPGWNLVDPESPDYIEHVRAFADLHQVTGLCQLDLRALAWSADPLPAKSQ